MKKFTPLLAVVAAFLTAGIITAIAVATEAGPTAQVQDEDAGGGGVASACLEGAEDCNDTAGLGEDSMSMCAAPEDPGPAQNAAQDGGAVPECNDVIVGTSRCIAVDNPGADPVAVPECTDMKDCTQPIGECVDVLPADPGIAVDPICIDDGSGDPCIDDGSISNPPSGVTASYDITIVFNESVTQGNLDEIAAIVQEIAPGTDFLIRESFPPVGVALMTTEMAEFCPDINAKFESLSYVSDATCAAAASEDPPVSDPDEPVSSQPGGAPGSGPIE